MSVEIIPLKGIPEVRAGDDLSQLILEAADRGGMAFQEGDVVVVTQKVVSKAEGRVVAALPGKDSWVRKESRRVVARRGDLVIAETRHGFVCANAGVDASNVAEGFLSLLPEDPDASAASIRSSMEARCGVALGVVITDTFGRPWRAGLVNVAIGCAGLPALVDLRGTPDALGRELEVTVVALADEVAAASGLAMGKADNVPVAVVRGLSHEGPPGRAADFVRKAQEDLFRESALQSLLAPPTDRFGDGEVPREALVEAIRAACSTTIAADEPGISFVVPRPASDRSRLPADVSPPEGTAALIIPCLQGSGGDELGSDGATALLEAGMAVRTLFLALHDQGLGVWWSPVPPARRDDVRRALAIGSGLVPVAVVAAGPWADGAAPPPVDVDPMVVEKAIVEPA